ncbi:hypothetical protein [Methylacidimicrobium sp. B4]|uniref:hypothetical protein n=1 Tax=Methylacidimicrobium sp. B4 TaxID=2796139 RepID=UPI001A8C128B|nr:hypothetical protein [Methylacidimicrobium sp. B4]QSR84580.1 hypothetical protein MacB4_10345 [Methylacidimicrobium sp. B4]
MRRLAILPLIIAFVGCAHAPDPVQYTSENPAVPPYDHPECDPKVAKYRKWIEMGRNEARSGLLNEGWDKIAKNGNGSTAQQPGQIQWRTSYVPKYTIGGVEYGGQYESIPVASP